MSREDRRAERQAERASRKAERQAERDAQRRAEKEQRKAEQAALRALYMAWSRLKDFGWNDPAYCPKDGTEFDVIELGSTGIFSCRYVGEWPRGLWEYMDDRDVYPTSRPPAMFRLKRHGWKI
jgi:hypothetical protein